MTLFEQAHTQMFVSGRAETNTWKKITLTNENGFTIDCEACIPNRGGVRVRVAFYNARLIQGQDFRSSGYRIFRFNKKRELVYVGCQLNFDTEGKSI